MNNVMSDPKLAAALAVAFVLASAGISGCSTVEGAGEDIEAAGDYVEETADDVEDELDD